jgi:hypothetical protein
LHIEILLVSLFFTFRPDWSEIGQQETVSYAPWHAFRFDHVQGWLVSGEPFMPERAEGGGTVKTGLLTYLTAVCVVVFLGACGGGGGGGGGGDSSPRESIALQTTAGDAQVSVDWNGMPDTSYNLCHAREPILEFDNCGLYQEGGLLIDVTPPLVVANLVNGQRYHFRVEAIRGGERSASSHASAVPVATTPTRRHTIYVVDSGGRLATVDPLGGNVSLIGRMNAVMTDIAFHPDGDLFGISFFDLYRIDEATAAITRVGRHGVPGGNSLVFSADGTLYAAGSDSFSLFQINPSSGATSNLGSIGFRAAGDLAFFGGSLFLASREGAFVKVDLEDLSRTVALGHFNRTDVYGLAPGDGGVLYGVAGTDIFKVNEQTGALRDIVSFGGKGLSSAYGMDSRVEPVVDETPLKPLFPIAGYEENPLNRLGYCFGAHGPPAFPDDPNKLLYFSGQYHAGVDLRTRDIDGGVIQAPVDGTLVYFRLLNEMNTFFILAGDDGRDYLFAHVDCTGVNGQGQNICVREVATGSDGERYPLSSRRRVDRGDVLGTTYPSNASIPIPYVRHLHFGVSTRRMVSDDGHLFEPFQSIRWARITYPPRRDPDTGPDAAAARDYAMSLGFIDPLTLFDTGGPSGCECLYATDSSFCPQE